MTMETVNQPGAVDSNEAENCSLGRAPFGGSRLVHGDCLSVMRDMEPESFDAVITDFPYGIDFQSARRIDKATWKPKIANDEAPFIWFLPQAFRVLKQGGGLAVLRPVRQRK